MNSEEKDLKLNFIFECEHCAESWSENLFEIIDQCTKEELLTLLKHIQIKISKRK